jgi:hypothetical protein
MDPELGEPSLPRVCVICKWGDFKIPLHGPLLPDWPRCRHPKSIKVDPVFGPQIVSCRQARAEGAPCGPVGALWEQKELEAEEVKPSTLERLRARFL